MCAGHVNPVRMFQSQDQVRSLGRQRPASEQKADKASLSAPTVLPPPGFRMIPRPFCAQADFVDL